MIEFALTAVILILILNIIHLTRYCRELEKTQKDLGLELRRITFKWLEAVGPQIASEQCIPMEVNDD
jgi:hypothetical protein